MIPPIDPPAADVDKIGGEVAPAPAPPPAYVPTDEGPYANPPERSPNEPEPEPPKQVLRVASVR